MHQQSLVEKIVTLRGKYEPEVEFERCCSKCGGISFWVTCLVTLIYTFGVGG